MTNRPVIFSGPMVGALLAGRKTQTRRLATSPLSRCQVGDRLYVRESFGCKLWDPPGVAGGRRPEPGDPVMYMADPENAHWGDGLPSQGGFVWRPSIHMPRWASRLTLDVTELRIQRLWDLTEVDAQAEGMFPASIYGGQYHSWLITEAMRDRFYDTAWAAFKALWSMLHDKPGQRWEDNPAIVALTFTVARRNIDAKEAS